MAGEATRQMPIIDALIDGSCLTTAALAEMTGIARKDVATACCSLVTRGWIVRRERGCFELSDEGHRAFLTGEIIKSGPKGPLNLKVPRRPKRRTVRDKIWSTIRILKKFRLADLETMAGASRDNAQRYVLALEAAGYLSRLRNEPGAAPTSNGFPRWLLTRTSGPAAPVYRVERCEVYDPNLGKAFTCGRSS